MIFCRGLILLLLFDLNLVAQTFITNNDWDFHLNIRDVNHMALYNNSIYCFSSNGLFSVDLESKNIQRNSNSLELENYKVVKTYQDSNYFILALQNGKLVIYNSCKNIFTWCVFRCFYRVYVPSCWFWRII